jgi:hypothetical protein
LSPQAGPSNSSSGNDAPGPSNAASSRGERSRDTTRRLREALNEEHLDEYGKLTKLSNPYRKRKRHAAAKAALKVGSDAAGHSSNDNDSDFANDESGSDESHDSNIEMVVSNEEVSISDSEVLLVDSLTAC